MPDERKEGGAYVTVIGVVKKIDYDNQVIILADKREIPISEIIDISFS